MRYLVHQPREIRSIERAGISMGTLCCVGPWQARRTGGTSLPLLQEGRPLFCKGFWMCLQVVQCSSIICRRCCVTQCPPFLVAGSSAPCGALELHPGTALENCTLHPAPAPCTCTPAPGPCTLHLHQFSITSGPFSITYMLNGPDVMLNWCRCRVQGQGCRFRVQVQGAGCRVQFSGAVPGCSSWSGCSAEV